MEKLVLESEIKKRTLRKLDTEIKKLEREVSYAFNADSMLNVTQMYYSLFSFPDNGVPILARCGG